MKHKKKCVVCGREFETNYPHKVTCSAECSNENRHKESLAYFAKKAAAKPPMIKKCLWCGKEFETRDGRLKCCSHACSKAHSENEYRRELARKRLANEAKLIKKCEVCGKEFKSPRGTAKYCSAKCKVKAHNEAANERKKRNPEQARARDRMYDRRKQLGLTHGKRWDKGNSAISIGLSRNTLDDISAEVFG